MKILHIINNLGSGGAEKLLEDLIPLMNEYDDIKADILLLTDRGNVFYDSLIKMGVKVDVIKHNNMYDPRNVLEIKKHILNGGYDVVHSHIFPTQYWVALSRLFLKNNNIKFITTEHNTYNRRRGKSYFRPIDKLIYSQYGTIISITEETKENLLKWIDPRRKNIDKHFVIENGVNIGKIKKALPYEKNKLINGINEDTKLVCMVGRFSEQKDQPTLIKAVSKLPEDVHLLLIGEGPLMENNKELSNKLGISDRIHFLGFRQDIASILKTVDVVILSSNWEGFGLVAVEGMSADKPVIASDVKGLAEVVKGAGLLFPKGDSEKLMIHIHSLLNNEKKYQQVREACIKRAESYGIERMAQEYNNLLRDNI